MELEEVEGIEAEMEEEEEGQYESGGEGETPEGMPTWSNDFESGPPKLSEQELSRVHGISRMHEIERLTNMTVLKKLPEGADLSKYKFLSNSDGYQITLQVQSPRRE